MSAVEDTRSITRDAYPADLALFVRERWDEERAGPLPDPDTLEALISACYQASLLREEERAVKFRVILCDPDRLPPNEGPPGGIHRLEFPEPRQFDIQEIRRLSPAADYYRSLIGVLLGRRGGVEDLGPRPLGTEVVEGGPGREGCPAVPAARPGLARARPGTYRRRHRSRSTLQAGRGQALRRLDGRIQIALAPRHLRAGQARARGDPRRAPRSGTQERARCGPAWTTTSPA